MTPGKMSAYQGSIRTFALVVLRAAALAATDRSTAKLSRHLGLASSADYGIIGSRGKYS
jgi:hypothetical protein